MITFIMSYELKHINMKLLLLYLLNLSDIILTLLLYRTGLFKELNSIMAAFLNNTTLAFMIKSLIPGLLLFLLYLRIKSANQKQLKISNYIISGAIILYLLVNFLHLLWISILPILNNFI